jgi:hypothetical protein
MSSHKQLERINVIQKHFEDNSKLFNHARIPEVMAKGENRVVAILPLNNHAVYGETVLVINELYDEFEDIKEYRYGWEYPKVKHGNNRKSKHERHITAFDKQAHPNPPYWVETDPYHHHNVPGSTSPRTETSIETLEDVITIFSDYIVSGKEFLESHTFWNKE